MNNVSMDCGYIVQSQTQLSRLADQSHVKFWLALFQNDFQVTWGWGSYGGTIVTNQLCYVYVQLPLAFSAIRSALQKRASQTTGLSPLILSVATITIDEL